MSALALQRILRRTTPGKSSGEAMGASKEAMGIVIPKLGSQLELQSGFPNHMKVKKKQHRAVFAISVCEMIKNHRIGGYPTF